MGVIRCCELAIKDRCNCAVHNWGEGTRSEILLMGRTWAVLGGFAEWNKLNC